MKPEEDIDRSAAFDELLREGIKLDANPSAAPKHSETIRLLHELFRVAPDVQSESSQSSSTVPEQVSRFLIKRLLGRGGFGTVYLADDPLLNRAVAVKVIHPHLLSDPNIRSRALREREAMARLQHPNILPVWEAGEDHGQVYFVSEYCAGPTLAQWLTEHPGPMDYSIAALWVSRLADAIAHSHQRGVIHRDLKPSNILLDNVPGHLSEKAPSLEEFEPRLSDFGLAKILDRKRSNSNSLPTQNGLFVGSLEYASPEQVQGRSDSIGVTSDVYGLGVLLYQLVTGQLPHRAESQYELARLICEEHPHFSKAMTRTVPRDLQAIALRAIARDAEDRYPSAAALRDDLERFLRREEVEARPVSLFESVVRSARSRPTISLLVGVCCGLALLLLLSLAINNNRLTAQQQALQRALQSANRQRMDAERLRQVAESRQLALSKLRHRESIKMAFEYWHAQNYIGLRETLSRLEPAQASAVEARWLMQKLAERYFCFELNNDPVHALTWDQSNKSLLTLGASGNLRRWDLQTQQPLRTDFTTRGAHSFAIDPKRQSIVIPEYTSSAAKTSTLTFWSYESCAPLAAEKLQKHGTTVECLAYSPDGRWLAAGARYRPVMITDLDTKETFALKSDRRNRQVAFSPQSDRIAIHTTNGKLKIYDLHSRQPLTTISNDMGGSPASIFSFAWLPQLDALVVNIHSNQIHILSAKDGKKLAEVYVQMEAENIAVSNDGRRLVLGNSEGCLQLFDLEALLAGRKDAVAMTPITRVLNGKVADVTFVGADQVVAADEEGNMIRWSPAPVHQSLTLAGDCHCLSWQDNQHLWVYDQRGRHIYYLELQPGQVKQLADTPMHVQQEIARTRNDQHIAMASRSGLITIAAAATGLTVATCQLPPVNTAQADLPVAEVLQFSADGKILFATGENIHLAAIRVEDGTIAWIQKLTNYGACVAENHLQGFLYVGGGFETLKELRADTGELVVEHVGGNGTHAIWADPAWQQLITGHRDGTVRRRMLGSDAPPTIQPLSQQGITAVAVSDDQQTFFFGDELGIVRATDDEIVSYGTLYSSRLSEPKVAQLQWSPDKQRLVALSFSKSADTSEIVMFEFGPFDGP